jgi:hypothetical protein
MDQVLGIKRPSGPSFTLNSAVDNLFKNEFDYYRKKGEPHPIMSKYKLDLIPLDHQKMGEWRDDSHRYIGAQIDIGDGFTLSGIIDDIWVDKNGVFYIADYKSTSTTKEINLEDEYKQGYKRQMEVYQYIYRKMGHKVSDTGYFVYTNAQKDLNRFDDKLTFETIIIPYVGSDAWIEPTLAKIKGCLNGELPTAHGEKCNFSRYLRLIKEKEAY